MVKLLKQILGILMRSLFVVPAYCLAVCLVLFKYSDSLAINMKIDLDRLVEKGGHRKRNRNGR